MHSGKIKRLLVSQGKHHSFDPCPSQYFTCGVSYYVRQRVKEYNCLIV